ncbi:hypothetical protein M0813_14748 [Anaeramoeba flamelloides]|uniref:DH domain-containing protein n=1 Tax=Anaeramoeba flamelloides TaxID=1746091 RepID=A0ABQ8Z597_9EUKA|nr:hypothetical protein M0813_14748 [Anaeramoeba flamelloides]
MEKLHEFGTTIDLDFLLNHKIALVYFEEFLREYKIAENLSFLLLANDYANIIDPVERALISGVLFEKYFSRLTPVRLKEETIKDIRTRYEKRIFRSNLFTSAYNEVKELLSNTYFPLFLKSKYLIPLLNDWKMINHGHIPRGPKKQRNTIFQNLLSSEYNFLETLLKFNRTVLRNLEIEAAVGSHITKEEHSVICINWKDLISFHKHFCGTLNKVSNSFNYEVSIGELFINSSSELTQVYSQYLLLYKDAVSLIVKFFRSKAQSNFFKKQIHKTEKELLSSIHLPLGRIESYKKIIKELFDNTLEHHPDYPNLIKAETILNSLLTYSEQNPLLKTALDKETSGFLKLKKLVFSSKIKIMNYQKNKQYNGLESLLFLFENQLAWCIAIKKDEKENGGNTNPVKGNENEKEIKRKKVMGKSKGKGKGKKNQKKKKKKKKGKEKNKEKGKGKEKEKERGKEKDHDQQSDSYDTNAMYTLFQVTDINGIYIKEGDGKYSGIQDNVIKVISPNIEISFSIEEKAKFLLLIQGCINKKSNEEENNVKNEIKKTQILFNNQIKYIGEIKGGKLCDKNSKLIYPSGTIFEGGFENNMKMGHGKLIFSNGDIIKSNWVLNSPKGISEIIFNDGSKYDGFLKNGMRHGYGKYTTLKGLSFRGSFIQNFVEGKGYIIYPSGSQYTGDFNLNYKDGFGIFEENDGSNYIGGWENDLKSGKGKMIYKNGDLYLGDWNKGLRHGYGKLFQQHEKYVGEWELDVKHGKGILWYNKNKIYFGNFENGLRSGQGTLIFNKIVYEGSWENDLPNGHGCFRRYKNLIDVSNLDSLGKMRSEEKEFNWEVTQFTQNNDLIQKLSAHWSNGYPVDNVVNEIINKIKYEGKMENGKKFGKGNVQFKNGSKISATWKNDTIEANSGFVYNLKKKKSFDHKLVSKKDGLPTFEKTNQNQLFTKIEQIDKINDISSIWITPPSETTFYNLWL